MKFKDSNMIIASHLQEVDDLKNHGRDGYLVDTPENRAVLKRQTEAIITKIQEGNKRAVLFVTSSRIRAIQTAELIADDIKKTTRRQFSYSLF